MLLGFSFVRIVLNQKEDKGYSYVARVPVFAHVYAQQMRACGITLRVTKCIRKLQET